MKMSNTLLQDFTHFVRKRKLVSLNQSVLLAVSGGVDSLVMLDLFAQLRKNWKLQLSVAHINHQLRGKESDEDEQFVKDTAKRYGIPFYCECVKTKDVAKSTKGNLQAVARDIRYSFFDNLRKELNADAVATAHTANDNAETLLLNLFRGTGIEGLSGISTKRSDAFVIRPLLFATRNDIALYAKKNNIQWREDSSNTKEIYTRNTIRRQILPAIQKLNPSIIETLNREAETFCDVQNYFDDVLLKNWNKVVRLHNNDISIHVKPLQHQHIFIQKLLLHKIFGKINCDPSFTHIHSVLALCAQQKGTQIQLNKQWRVERTALTIDFYREQTGNQRIEKLTKPGTLVTEQFTFTLQTATEGYNKKNSNPSVEYVDAAKIIFPVRIRTWRSGDTFHPLGMKGSKKLSNFFVDLKLSHRQKEQIPIIESNKRIVWVGGYRLDERFKITPKTKTLYRLTLTFTHGKKEDHR